MAREPSLLFDGVQPNWTYTAIMLDFSIVAVSTEPPSAFLASSMAYLSFVQTSLRPIDESNVLGSKREPLVPFGTPDTTSTKPHLMVILLFGNPPNSTLARKLQQELHEIGQCEDSRSEFDFASFLAQTGLGNPVAANWFTVVWNTEQGYADYVTTVIPTVTQTVTGSPSSTSILPANRTQTTVGANVTAPLTRALHITDGKTAEVPSTGRTDTATSCTPASAYATLESSGQPATAAAVLSSMRANTSSSYSAAVHSPVSLALSSLTTLTLNPTAALGVGSGAAVGTGELGPTSTAGLGVTAGGVKDSEPAVVGAFAALMVTGGFYWVFL
ncbi:hypothetical protein CONLIGDRAFT_718329 [Coniochaeta ligniaria NRRL 30616]|uniref:Uncharacterized protein n=1 Tax=Coniochaeta ligniaria NRRL 30616 TaxID=1408157 RepID=A0A1J7J5D7_9PEZI|nr:hypothetical protein CONLIGDRAFT_718329 [Coniochaeta ligniaria NRRL 30616]